MEAKTYKPDTSNFQNGRVEIHVPISIGLTPQNVCACSMPRSGGLFVFDGLWWLFVLFILLKLFITLFKMSFLKSSET